MRKKNTRKLTACLLVLTLAFTAVGCGSSKEQNTAAETAETEANDLETIGSGTDMNRELDTKKAEPSVPLKEALTITASHMETEPGRNKLYVDIENTTANDVTIEWLDFLIDGKAASNDSDSEFWDWFPDHWSAEIKAGDTYQEKFFIDHPVEHTEYVEVSIEATVSDSSKTQTEPLNITISLKDIETVDTSEISTAPTSIHIDEQELYNENNIVITIPEQTIAPSAMPTFHLECQYDYGLYYSFLNLRVGGVLIAEGSHSNADGEINPEKPSDDTIPVDFWAAVDSGRDSGEVTFILDIWSDPWTSIDKPEITIPFTIIKK